MRLGVELFGGLFAAAVLILIVAAWRLSEGPIRTDFLTPYLQAAINQLDGNTVEIGGTFLVWEKDNRELVFHAAEVVVRDPERRLIAALPEVAFELSTSAVLQGTLAPNQIEIIAPRLRLLRAEDGSISFGKESTTPLGAPAAGAPAAGAPAVGERASSPATTGADVVLGELLGQLMGGRKSDSPLSYLDEVRIRDGQIYVRDDFLGLSWAAPSADISLRRDVAGLAGDISLSFTGQRDPATFDAAFLFDKRAGIVDLAAGFSDISLAALAQTFPLLAPVGGLTSRISGSVSTSLSLDGTVGHTGFDLHGFAGTLRIPGIDMPALPVRELTMRGRYDSSETSFNLHEARIGLGSAEEPGPIFSIGGLFDYDPTDRGWVIDADAELENVPLADLATYWPESIAEGARPWVIENVTAGQVDRATAALDVVVPAGDFSAAEVTALSGVLRYRGLEVHYLRPLPSIRGIDGSAKYDLDSLRFEVASGWLESLVLSDSRVAITGFAKSDSKRRIYEQLTIDAQVLGPVSDTLAILEHPRLDLLSQLGFSAAGSGGLVSAAVGFQFPLSKDLTFDDVTLQVDAAVQDAQLRQVILGQDMTEGRLDIDLDERGMELSGPLKLGGVPLTVNWKESFAANAKVRSVMEAEILRSLDEERARFGLDIGDVVVGPLAATVSMISRDEGPTTLRVATDLKEATISLPEIHWSKQVGTEGSLSLTIDLDDRGPIAYRDIVLQAGDLIARGKATPGPERIGLGTIDLERVAFGRSDLQRVALKLGEEGIDVAIGQGILDAEPFVAEDEDQAAVEKELSRGGDKQHTPKEQRVFEPLTIRAPKLDILYFAEERRLELVNLELRRSRQGWETIRLSGSIPEQYWSPPPKRAAEQPAPAPDNAEAAPQASAELTRRYLQFSFASDAASSGKRLLAMSDDLGALLRATNIADTVVGGSIEITGHSEGPSPAYPMTAKVAARDFVMVNAPTLAKLLTVASFTGIVDLLGGEGIGFQGMDGEFILDDGVATTELMRIYGAALGLTAKGRIDFNEDAIDLTGVVVPAYSINDFLNKIPLLGTLLTGGEGEGLIAVAYSVKGEVDDPAVSVNPLTAFAPGFLRNLFTAAPTQTGEGAVGAAPDFRNRIDK